MQTDNREPFSEPCYEVICKCGSVRYYKLPEPPSLTRCPDCVGLAFGLRQKRLYSRPRNVTNFQQQQVAAAQMEMRMLAYMSDLEAKGIVERVTPDSWNVLDNEKFHELTGMVVSEKKDAR